MASRLVRLCPSWAAALLVLGAAMIGAPAAAQTYGVGAGSASFGNVASAVTGDTEFTIDASSGSVTRNSGLGGRVSTGSANATVTISCGAQNACNTTSVNVKVGSVGTPTGRAKAIIDFDVANGTGTVSNVAGSNPTTFTLSPIGKSSSKTFKLGMTFRVKGDDSGVSTATAAATSYYVSVAAAPSVPPSSGTSGSVTMTVFRSLSISKTSNLSFGRIVRPASGSGSARIAASNGARTPTNVTWLTTPASTRAAYTVTGEGGKTVAIDIPASFVMQNALGNTITVSTETTVVGGSATLSSIAGSSGTSSFFVGGTVPLNSTTPSGSYTGTFAVTANYN